MGDLSILPLYRLVTPQISFQTPYQYLPAFIRCISICVYQCSSAVPLFGCNPLKRLTLSIANINALLTLMLFSPQKKTGKRR